MDLTYTYNYRHAIPRLRLTDKQLTNAHSITITTDRQTIDHWKKTTTRLLKEENLCFLFQKSPANRPQVVIKKI